MLLTKLFGKAKNYSSDIIADKPKQARLNTCNRCPKYREDFTYLLFFKKKGISQCGICKCSINDKVIWEDEKCPVGKWG